MIYFLLGLSITINIVMLIGYFIIYKYSLKGLKKKIENYTLDNFLGDNIDLGGIYDNK